MTPPAMADSRNDTNRDLSRMSWTQVASVLKSPATVLVPVGTSEAQGPYNPVAVDYLLSFEFARRVAEESEATFYLTGIPYGNSAAFRGFSGTVWLRPQTLEHLVYDVCHSLMEQGFEKIIIVNNHGPNEPAIEAALRRLRSEHNLLVPVLWPSQLAKRWAPDLFAKEALGHGSEPASSLIAYLQPDLACQDALHEGQGDNYVTWQGLQPQSSSQVKFKDQPVGLYLDVDEYTGTALRGKPVGDAGLGRQLMAHLVSFGKDFVRHFQQMDLRARATQIGE